SYTIPGTGQSGCYDDSGRSVDCGSSRWPSQDAATAVNPPAYRDNGDGTVSDLVTGLMWTRDPGAKKSWAAAVAAAPNVRTGGYADWRLPTVTELYSLIDFDGVTGTSAASSTPYIDTGVFAFSYGNTAAGERFIDAQYWSATGYVSTTMNGEATAFGVNFADGRIKGYPRNRMNGFALYVRGATGYGSHRYADNGDGTVTDAATGRIWQKNDDGTGRNWREALTYCADLTLGGSGDWRLPNAKESQGIVDYTRSPGATGSPAADPVFGFTRIVNGRGETDYGYYWTSTTHRDGPAKGDVAVYVAFGRAMGYMPPGYTLMDVHGAGAQRSDPKSGDPADYPRGRGPQGDVIGIYNFVRCVR
ncbi:MAG: DUF1566 domain-containing protein, partial [Nitrospinae bacterium]|nr:DUF1566 domain-containing protein [Nitrospinota bacterium]